MAFTHVARTVSASAAATNGARRANARIRPSTIKASADAVSATSPQKKTVRVYASGLRSTSLKVDFVSNVPGDIRYCNSRGDMRIRITPTAILIHASAPEPAPTSTGRTVPPEGEVGSSGAPHSPQNFAPGALGAWHERHH